MATRDGDAGIDTLTRRDGPLHLEKARRGRHWGGTGYVQVRVSFLSAVNADVTRAQVAGSLRVISKPQLR